MNNKMKNKATERHSARRLAVQALYQWHFNPNDTAHLVAQVMAEHPSDEPIEYAYLVAVVEGCLNEMTILDDWIKKTGSRQLSMLSPVELAVMRLATYELAQRLEVPYRVVINEALELTREFGVEEGRKYVNAVLDKIASQLRVDEHAKPRQ